MRGPYCRAVGKRVVSPFQFACRTAPACRPRVPGADKSATGRTPRGRTTRLCFFAQPAPNLARTLGSGTFFSGTWVNCINNASRVECRAWPPCRTPGRPAAGRPHLACIGSRRDESSSRSCSGSAQECYGQTSASTICRRDLEFLSHRPLCRGRSVLRSGRSGSAPGGQVPCAQHRRPGCWPARSCPVRIAWS